MILIMNRNYINNSNNMHIPHIMQLNPLNHMNNLNSKNSNNNLEDKDIQDIESTSISILKNIVNNLSSNLEMLLMSRLMFTNMSIYSTIIICILSSIIKYCIGFFSFKFRNFIEEQKYKLEYTSLHNACNIILALDKFIKINKSNLKSIKKNYDSYNKYTDFYISTKSLPNDGLVISDDIKYIYNYNNEKIEFIKKKIIKDDNIIHGLTYYNLEFYGKNKEIVTKFVKEIITIYNKEDLYSKIILIDQNTYKNSQLDSKSININKTLENLFLPNKINKDCYHIIKNFNNILDRKEQIGMSRKLGILLSGHSGCGKTSTVFALSKELNMQIYKVLPPIDKTIDIAFNNVPDNSIILIDDFDSSYFLNTETENNKEITIDSNLYENNKQNQSTSNTLKNNIDNNLEKKKELKIQKQNIINKLLSIFDGYYGFKNCIIVLTTNRPNNIEPELLRPGRIDYHFNFGKTVLDYQITNSFTKFYDCKKEDIEPHIKNIIDNQNTMSNIMSCISSYTNYSEAIEYLSNNSSKVKSA